jgi:hypothetical protein
MAAMRAAARGDSDAGADSGVGARALFDRYVEARRATGESVAGLSVEKLAASLRSQAEKLRGKLGNDKKVDFEVVTKDGKTLIKPVVK